MVTHLFQHKWLSISHTAPNMLGVVTTHARLPTLGPGMCDFCGMLSKCKSTGPSRQLGGISPSFPKGPDTLMKVTCAYDLILTHFPSPVSPAGDILGGGTTRLTLICLAGAYWSLLFTSTHWQRITCMGLIWPNIVNYIRMMYN